MMSSRSAAGVCLTLLVLIASSLVGCGNKPGRDAEAPAVSVDVDAVRERYHRLNSQNRVGVVTAVRRGANLAAVGDIPLQDFGIGDVLVFIDGRERPFNSGEVVNATSDALHVRFDGERRAPRVGEMAVRLR